MSVCFFAARRLHQEYFTRVAAALQQREVSTCVLWHKNLWKAPGWLWLLPQTLFATELTAILDDLIREKQARRPGSALWWSGFRLLKRLEASLLLAIYQHSLCRCDGDQPLMVIWNGLKYRQRIAVYAARRLGIEPVFMENGLLPGMTTLDPAGVNYLNSVPRDPQQLLQQAGGSQYQPALQLEDSDGRADDWPEHYVFVPFQVNTDSQIILFSPWLANMTALVEALQEAEQQLGEQMPNILLKTHPADPTDYQALKQRLASGNSRIRLLTEGNTAALIRHADAVATINSTVGIEALIANKPLLVLGRAFYSYPGLVLQADNQAALTHQLSVLCQFQPNPTLRQALLNYLRFQYQIPGRWQEADEAHLDAVCTRLQNLRETV